MAARCSCGCRSLVRWRPRVLRVTVAAVAPLRAGALACSASLLRPSLPLVAACLVRSDSPRLLRNWRVCHPVVTDRCCAPAFLAGCGTRSARHAAPFFRDGRLNAPSATRSINQRRAVRSGGAARCSSERKVTLRKGVFEGQTARPTRDVDRTATDALPKGIRGHSTTRERSDRDCHAVTISDAPSAATERPCAARLWESRRRHEQRVRRRVPAPPSDGRERERNLVERARPRSQGPMARMDGAERTLAPWWSERVRAAGGRGRERTARCEQLATEGARGRRRAHTRVLVERATVPVCSAQKRNRLGRVPEAGMRLRGLEPPRVLPH